MAILQPTESFNWAKVFWRAPDEYVDEEDRSCSYCSGKIGEDTVPFILWNKDSWMAEFCDDCVATYWGML